MYRVYVVCLSNDTIDNCAISFTSDLRVWLARNSSAHILRVEEVPDKLCQEINKAMRALDKRVCPYTDTKKWFGLACRTLRAQTLDKLFDLVVNEY